MDTTGKEAGTREKILIAAGVIFSEQGYHGASMQHIAAKAGVNKAMIFYYFNSKENLYQETVKHIYDSFFNLPEEKFGKDVNFEERLSLTLKRYIKHFSESRDFAKIFLREFLGMGPGLPFSFEKIFDELRKPLVSLIAEGIEKGIILKCDTQYLSEAIMGMLHVCHKPMMCLSGEGGECAKPVFYDYDYVYNETMQILKNGIFTGGK